MFVSVVLLLVFDVLLLVGVVELFVEFELFEDEELFVVGVGLCCVCWVVCVLHFWPSGFCSFHDLIAVATWPSSFKFSQKVT